MRTKILYEDEQILIIHKPAGLATQTSKVGQQDVVSELKNYLARKNKGKVPYLGVIHRLDQPVEGLLVFAKEKQAAAVLTKQLGAGTLNKRYYALICGQVQGKSGELVDYLYKDKDGKAQVADGFAEGAKQKQTVDIIAEDAQRTRKADNAERDAKKAVLQYKIVQEYPQGYFLTDIHIDTGRFHQIRAQMSHAGMPLLGDSKYGNEKSLEMSRRLGVRNVALCAYYLEILHPVTGKKLEFEIELPNFCNKI